jgi:outer membrane protein assembly factor BamB
LLRDAYTVNRNKLLTATLTIIILSSCFACLLETGITKATTTFYDVTFTETGLASGTSWNVTCAGTTHASTSNKITFSSSSVGTYAYTIKTPDGYTLGSAATSLVTFKDETTNIAVTFASNDGSNWPMYQHDILHTGNVNGTGPLVNNTQWSSDVENGINAMRLSSIIAANGIVYAHANASLYALDAFTGEQLWSFTAASDVPFDTSAAVANGIVYVGGNFEDENGALFALNATTGAQLWNSSTGYIEVSSPTVFEGVVYIGSLNHILYAFNATTGAQLWTHDVGTIIYSSAVVANETLYVCGQNGVIHALNIANGAEQWNYNIYSGTTGSPSIANGILYMGGTGGIYAINTTSHALLWWQSVNNYVQGLSITDGVVYTATWGKIAYALNATDGNQLWSHTLPEYVDSCPVVVGGVFYIGANDQNMYALNASTGTEIWRYTLNGRIENSAAVTNGNLYIGSATGRIYAFGPTDNLTMNTVGQGSVFPGNGTHAVGAPVHLEAVPAAGWGFSGWSGDASGESNTTIVMDANKTVTATFTPLYNLTINLYIDNVLNSNVTDIIPYSNGTICSNAFNIAILPPEYLFDHLSVDGLPIAGLSYNVTMNQNHIIDVYVNTNMLQLTVNPSIGGTCNLSIGNHAYAYGTNITLTATPAEGYIFHSWVLGDGVSYSNPSTLQITENWTIWPEFTIDPNFAYNVTFTIQDVPEGIEWSVTLNQTTLTTKTTNITFTIPYGNYTYSITLPQGYTSTTQLTGNLDITSSTQTIEIAASKQSSTSPSLTATPTPTLTPKPTTTPQPTVTPSATPASTASPTATPAQVSQSGTNLTVIAATIVILLVLFGLFLKRKNRNGNKNKNLTLKH